VELAVIPRWMRQGIGTALLERACEWGRARGYPAITLTTYADVPWNAPWYARRGFVEVTDLGPGLAAERAHEAELGLDAVGPRIVMRRDLT
jgi:GNAT superfamily N-acetyltransferase